MTTNTPVNRDAILGAITARLAAHRTVIAGSDVADMLAAEFEQVREFDHGSETWAEFTATATEFTGFTVHYGCGGAGMFTTVFVGELVDAVVDALQACPMKG